MKPIINSKKKQNIINKANAYQRRSSLNPDSNNKIYTIYRNSEISSMFKTNKTLHKYINQKLNLLKSHPKAKKNNNISIKSNIYSRNPSINIVKSDKNRKKKVKNKKIISINIPKNKIKIGINNNHDDLLSKKEYNSNNIYSSFSDLPNLLNNKSNNIINTIKNKNFIVKSPLHTKGKLISNLYQNYTSSMSTGISYNNNNNDLFKSCSNFLDNNTFQKEDKDNNDSKNDFKEKEYFPLMNQKYKFNSNEERNNRNNNTTTNYEIDSSEENVMNNKIFFKGGEDGSPITFGNSFSYTNSKRSSSTRRILKNNENENIDNIINKDNENISLLKSQNETLKKELKESNEQITYLKNQIEKLIKKKKKNYNCSIRINRCPKPMPPVKKYSKNNSYFEQRVLNTNNYCSHDNKYNKKFKKSENI